jgi:CelD/BcsL family acetyltransferase involved in cellulose biosynthesis
MLKTELLTGAAVLARLASDWERLWQASRQPVPNLRPGLVSLFQQCFAPAATPCAVAVRSGGQLAGLLPLLLLPRRGLMMQATNASNDWVQCGRPLLAAGHAGCAAICAALLEGVARLGAGSVTLSQVPLDDPAMQGLVSASTQLGWPTRVRADFEVGLIRLPETVERFQGNLSRNRRKKLRHDLRLAESQGSVQLVEVHRRSAEELDQWLAELDAIEQASWKLSVSGTFAQHPAARQFRDGWARQLRADGQLRLYLLEVGGEQVAFDLGWLARGVYASWKTGYRESCAGYGPGHLLNAMVCERLIESAEAHCIDTIGPLDRRKNPCCSDAWRSGRVVIAPGRGLRNVSGRSMVALLNVWDAWRPAPVPVSAPRE